MRGMTVCDKVCLSVVLTSILFSCDESVFLVDKTPGEEIYDD